MSGKSWADFEERERLFAESGPTIQDYADLIKEVLDYPEGVSGGDYDFICGLAELDEHEPLSPKQVAWLDDIEGKIG